MPHADTPIPHYKRGCVGCDVSGRYEQKAMKNS